MVQIQLHMMYRDCTLGRGNAVIVYHLYAYHQCVHIYYFMSFVGYMLFYESFDKKIYYMVHQYSRIVHGLFYWNYMSHIYIYILCRIYRYFFNKKGKKVQRPLISRILTLNYPVIIHHFIIIIIILLNFTHLPYIINMKTKHYN